MKNWLIVFFIMILFMACNNNPVVHEKVISKEEELNSLMQQYPDSLLVIENIVQYYRDKGNYDRAIAITNKAIQKDSTEAAFWDMKATLAYENGDTLDAAMAYEQLIELEPLPDHIIALASVYAQLRDKRALGIADALLKQNEAGFGKEAYFIKGMYYNFSGDKSKAITFFNQCIEIDYTYVLAYREKAIALYELKNYEAALKVLKTATTVQISFEEGYYWMGRCYEKLGNIPEAARAYQLALLYDKDYAEAREALEHLQQSS